MTSLELDENALMDVLDVPYWIRITSAKCDRVFFQVPFMAIKKVPMSLVINCLNILIFVRKIKLLPNIVYMHNVNKYRILLHNNVGNLKLEINDLKIK